MHDDAILHELVNSLAFEVEAVPQDSVGKSTIVLNNAMPLNVKVRVRKKDEPRLIQRGTISVPKVANKSNVFRRIRLVSSDQTMLSFNILLESALEKKISPKSKRAFNMLNFGGCLEPSRVDDVGPYLPSNSKRSDLNYEIEGAVNNEKLKFVDQNSKVAPNIVVRKNKNFFGKCKPGGCLDPPFGDERYSYKPVLIKPSENKQSSKDIPTKLLIEQTLQEKVVDIDRRLPKEITPNEALKTQLVTKSYVESKTLLSLYQATPVSVKNSIRTNDSNSIITYPITSSSDILLNNQNTEKTFKRKERSIQLEDKSNLNQSRNSYLKPSNEVPFIKDIINLQHYLPKVTTSKTSTDYNIVKDNITKQYDDDYNTPSSNFKIAPEKLEDATSKTKTKNIIIDKLNMIDINESHKDNLSPPGINDIYLTTHLPNIGRCGNVTETVSNQTNQSNIASTAEPRDHTKLVEKAQETYVESKTFIKTPYPVPSSEMESKPDIGLNKVLGDRNILKSNTEHFAYKIEQKNLNTESPLQNGVDIINISKPSKEQIHKESVFCTLQSKNDHKNINNITGKELDDLYLENLSRSFSDEDTKDLEKNSEYAQKKENEIKGQNEKETIGSRRNINIPQRISVINSKTILDANLHSISSLTKDNQTQARNTYVENTDVIVTGDKILPNSNSNFPDKQSIDPKLSVALMETSVPVNEYSIYDDDKMVLISNSGSENRNITVIGSDTRLRKQNVRKSQLYQDFNDNVRNTAESKKKTSKILPIIDTSKLDNEAMHSKTGSSILVDTDNVDIKKETITDTDQPDGNDYIREIYNDTKGNDYGRETRVDINNKIYDDDIKRETSPVAEKIASNDTKIEGSLKNNPSIMMNNRLETENKDLLQDYVQDQRSTKSRISNAKSPESFNIENYESPDLDDVRLEKLKLLDSSYKTDNVSESDTDMHATSTRIPHKEANLQQSSSIKEPQNYVYTDSDVIEAAEGTVIKIKTSNGFKTDNLSIFDNDMHSTSKRMAQKETDLQQSSSIKEVQPHVYTDSDVNEAAEETIIKMKTSNVGEKYYMPEKYYKEEVNRTSSEIKDNYSERYSVADTKEPKVFTIDNISPADDDHDKLDGKQTMHSNINSDLSSIKGEENDMPTKQSKELITESFISKVKTLSKPSNDVIENVITSTGLLSKRIFTDESIDKEENNFEKTKLIDNIERSPSMPLDSHDRKYKLQSEYAIPNLVQKSLLKESDNKLMEHVALQKYPKYLNSTYTKKDTMDLDDKMLVLDLSFQKYFNDKNERVIKSLSTSDQQYADENNMLMLKSTIRLDNEISIPVDSKTDLSLSFRKKSKDTIKMKSHSANQIAKQISEAEVLSQSLAVIYEHELIPLQDLIRDLNEEINKLSLQQDILRKNIRSVKRVKSMRLFPTYKKCGCLKIK